MRVIRIIELDGTPEFVKRTLTMSWTHEQSLEVSDGCYVTGTVLPEDALLDPEVERAITTLKAHARRLNDLGDRT